MRKVIIIGSPGAGGKSTFARKLREENRTSSLLSGSDLAQTGSDEYIPGRV